MNKEDIFKDLYDCVVEMDVQKGKDAATLLIKENYSPLEGIENGLSKGMEVIGEKFNKLEIFLPELMMAAGAFTSAMTILKPHILSDSSDKSESLKKGTVLIGTVKGDIHKIGKDIVAILLETAGFNVHNIGEDVSTSTFIEEAGRVDADIIALSSLLTTTMASQKDLIDILKEIGQREKYLVMVGGAPTSQKWADEIGADIYGENAERAVALALEFLSKKQKS
ncbi:MAG: corrinoid protein [Candidatus Marinimicrobia bacterium]|jgi:corrinoid protein of di/trimethylamine methyltransferase|nr:corrinoid protein [Candidatus Neomarinimicrobiota bacterium]MDP6578722.1 corrinoid protein [Candidatus Neomarinimicrobiota bacterium]MDP7061098.1 corrinoid protein [Candidatus Neomarinimicrobiota bacterium]|tara:strand:- start:778 stop:1449 length:672 start_codon:yes stop_codon:yes gene_type:complete